MSQHLTRRQLARADALDRARRVLSAQTPLSSGGADALDLVHVASWILDGRDPWLSDVIAVPRNGLALPETEGTAA